MLKVVLAALVAGIVVVVVVRSLPDLRRYRAIRKM